MIFRINKVNETGILASRWRVLNQLIDIIQSLRIANNEGVYRVKSTANGQVLEFQTTKKEAVEGGMVFTGEYASSRAYSAQEVVKISIGEHAGTYIAIADISAGSVFPWQGGNWVLLGRTTEQGIFGA